MSRVKHNILANAFGRGWASINFLVFTPVYLHLLGVEAYGMIGFFTTLQAVMFLLDAGLSTSLNRELARSTAGAREAGESRDLLRTLEIIYFLLAGGILLLVVAGSVPLSRFWLHGRQFSAGDLQRVIMYMGLALSMQFPVHLYENGLNGLQRQVLASAIASVFVTLRYGGAALLLWLYAPTLEVFFSWLVVTLGIQTFVTRLLLWRSLPEAVVKPRFNLQVLKEIRRFAAGIMGFSVANTLYQQADKVILSNLLPLSAYGYYMLAATVAVGLRVLIMPVYNAFFPRMSQLVESGLKEELREFYHRGCQLIMIVMGSASWTVIFFAPQILHVWTGNPGAVSNASGVLSLLMAGVLANALFSIPMGLQLAHGWVGLLFRLRVLMLALIVPVLIYATRIYGMEGAAASLLILELLFVGLGIIAMHRRMLQGDLGRWLLQDSLLPAGAAFIVVMVSAGALQFRLESLMDEVWATCLILGTMMVAMVTAALTVPWLRQILVQWFRRALGRD